jgi:hypothetical protein
MLAFWGSESSNSALASGFRGGRRISPNASLTNQYRSYSKTARETGSFPGSRISE